MAIRKSDLVKKTSTKKSSAKKSTKKPASKKTGTKKPAAKKTVSKRSSSMSPKPIGSLSQKAPFEKAVKNTCGKDFKYSAEALSLLQEIFEARAVDMFKMAMKIAANCKRVTILARDVNVAVGREHQSSKNKPSFLFKDAALVRMARRAGAHRVSAHAKYLMDLYLYEDLRKMCSEIHKIMKRDDKKMLMKTHIIEIVNSKNMIINL